MLEKEDGVVILGTKLEYFEAMIFRAQLLDHPLSTTPTGLGVEEVCLSVEACGWDPILRPIGCIANTQFSTPTSRRISHQVWLEWVQRSEKMRKTENIGALQLTFKNTRPRNTEKLEIRKSEIVPSKPNQGPSISSLFNNTHPSNRPEQEQQRHSILQFSYNANNLFRNILSFVILCCLDIFLRVCKIYQELVLSKIQFQAPFGDRS
ncbi:hypothetical protein Fcan01_12076 [Folsomia candida]|uniref:Uncharacterized protein n=1 Tax=Folsomia candida TaxID=158441 RepID=A0A226E5L3_FOLCA|nr:hypothetical protein Fcan01_12076 [Folsomia candida]